jgi:hypothetical protein
MGKMDRHDVWDLVDDKRQPVLDGKWVYTEKLDGATGKPSAYKARFVVKGFKQIAGRVYAELFGSPTKTLFDSLVNFYDLEAHQTDNVGAFLNGEIDRELYVRPPEGAVYKPTSCSSSSALCTA